MCSLIIHDCHVNQKSFLSKKERPRQFSCMVAGLLFKSSFVKGKFKESQMVTCHQAGCGYPVSLVFTTDKGLMHLGTYQKKALIFFSLTHKLSLPDEI